VFDPEVLGLMLARLEMRALTVAEGPCHIIGFAQKVNRAQNASSRKTSFN
jgi:hypothetical protein